MLDTKVADRLAFKIVFNFALAAVAVWLVVELKTIIIVLILSLTIAAAMAPIAEFAESRKIPRVAAVVLIYLFFTAVYVLMGITLVPAIVHQWQTLNTNLPGYIDRVQNWYGTLMNYAGGTMSGAAPSTDDIKNFGAGILKKTLDASAGFFGLVLNGILMLFLSAYFVVEAKPIWRSLMRWLPPDLAATISPHMGALSQRMGGYVRGQLLTALAVSIFFAIAFSLVKLEYGLALAALAGLLNLVPYVGSFTATALALVVGFNQDPIMAVVVLVIFGVEQWLESTIFVPFLLGKQVELHPLIVLLSMLAGATLLGIVGAIIAIPLASSTIYLAEEFYIKAREKSEAQTT